MKQLPPLRCFVLINVVCKKTVSPLTAAVMQTRTPVAEGLSLGLMPTPRSSMLAPGQSPYLPGLMASPGTFALSSPMMQPGHTSFHPGASPHLTPRNPVLGLSGSPSAFLKSPGFHAGLQSMAMHSLDDFKMPPPATVASPENRSVLGRFRAFCSETSPAIDGGMFCC